MPSSWPSRPRPWTSCRRAANARGRHRSADEFAALAVPFADRGRRTEEYLAAMRTLWREDVAGFDGEFIRFTSGLIPSRYATGASRS
ncbi:LLM class flavin-dependent oxidoreductase [Streptomyces cyaneofuscatus]|uniref:LLM class flavin-dependent oxidoreductase n=1 Tax=Streptomyces cyaneofuscatus TaxID=66883 RepID=UPI00341C37D7